MATNPISYNQVSNQTFNSVEVSSVVVTDFIYRLKNSSAFYVTIIKSIIGVIGSPLTKLINLCISTPTFPECLKIAMVISILKKGDRNDPNT